MTNAERILRHAVRVRVVYRYVGELCQVLGVAALVPAAAAVLFREYDAVPPYLAAGLVFFGLGILGRRWPAPREIQRNEALVIAAAAFALAPLVLSGPLVFHGIPWLDAFFEATSGVTTTGLSTLASVEARSQTFLFARAWMQWVGGLGFVVLSLALTLEPGVASRRLGSAGLDPEQVAGSMRAHARRVLWVYLCLTAFGAVVLIVLGAGIFDAVVHCFAAITTGGFAPRDTSLAALAPHLRFGILGVALLGAVPLVLYIELGRRRPGRCVRDAEVRALLFCVVLVGALLLATARFDATSADLRLADLALLAVSAQTTTGFSTLSPASLPATGQVILILSMIVGGSHGSTAGGIKLLRVLVVMRLLYWLVAQTRLPPHAVSNPTLSGERLGEAELLRAAALTLLFLMVLAGSWICFLGYGYPPLQALFEVASATGTVGLSAGITRPELEPALKVILCVNMLLGRLEVFAVLVALSPGTWFGRRASE